MTTRKLFGKDASKNPVILFELVLSQEEDEKLLTEFLRFKNLPMREKVGADCPLALRARDANAGMEAVEKQIVISLRNIDHIV